MVCQMEEMNKVNCGGENGSSSEGLPPNPLAAAYRQCFSATRVSSIRKATLVRHPSLVSCPIFGENLDLDLCYVYCCIQLCIIFVVGDVYHFLCQNYC